MLVDRGHLWKGAPVKMLTEGKSKSGGRNNHGRITTRHIGGGHKQAYRKVDFRRRKLDMPAKVERLEYDPNRTAFIALLKYDDGTLAYILAPQRLAVGDTVVSGVKADVKPGNAMQLASMPIGTIVHNIELKAGRRRQDRPLGRRLCAARRPRCRLGHPAAQLGRDAARARGVHGDRRRRVQPRPRERSRPARPAARAGGVRGPPCARSP